MYYIMTERGHQQTTRRKAILHAASTADSLSDVGADVVAPKGACFMEHARYAYDKGVSRGNYPNTMTTAQYKLHLYSRLFAHKLKVGIKLIDIPAAEPVTYRVISSWKSSWIVERKLFTHSEKYLITRRHDNTRVVVKLPSNTNNCRQALTDYYPDDRRRGKDRRRSQ